MTALEPGARFCWSRTISDDDIRRFAELSGDRGRHHLERDASGRLMAHGLLTATLPTKIGGDLHYMAKTMVFDFLKAVYGGDRLTCEGEVVGVIVQRARLKVRLRFEIVNQDGEVVLRGTSTGQILRAEAA